MTFEECRKKAIKLAIKETLLRCELKKNPENAQLTEQLEEARQRFEEFKRKTNPGMWCHAGSQRHEELFDTIALTCQSYLKYEHTKTEIRRAVEGIISH